MLVGLSEGFLSHAGGVQLDTATVEGNGYFFLSVPKAPLPQLWRLGLVATELSGVLFMDADLFPPIVSLSNSSAAEVCKHSGQMSH